MPKSLLMGAGSQGQRRSVPRRGLSILDVLVGLSVIFVAICFALAAKRDMMSAEAPSTLPTLTIITHR